MDFFLQGKNANMQEFTIHILHGRHTRGSLCQFRARFSGTNVFFIDFRVKLRDLRKYSNLH